MKFHIVQKNESLWSIAKKYGVDFEQLKMANGQLSNPNVLMPGMKVKVPTDHTAKEKPTTHKKHEHIVKEQPKHPFVQQKEQPKEVPKPIPQPKKEQPKPKPKPKKEQPKHIYHQPVMPYLPEIDINNYYTMNMQQLQQMQQPPQQPIQPQLPPQQAPIQKEEPIESPHIHESPEYPYVQQPMYYQPIQPQYDPCYPCQQPTYPVMPQPLPGMVQPTGWQEEQTYPMMPQQAYIPCMPQPMPCYPGQMYPQMHQAYPQQYLQPQPYGGGIYPYQAIPEARPFGEQNEEDDYE